MNKNKVLVIGIDGGTFDIIKPMVEKGKLPNLASIMRNGISGELISTIPFLTSTAFTSFMTGVNPGKHRIFGFTGNSHLQYGDGPILNASDIGAETIWETLNNNKKKVLLLAVPFTYPPPKISGAMVYTDIHSKGKIYAYPPELLEELRKLIGPYKKIFSGQKSVNSKSKEAILDNWVEDSNYKIKKVKEAFLYLLKRIDWDFSMTVFKTTDVIQHRFWRYMEQSHVAYDENLASKYKNAIYDTYDGVDAAIGEILKQIDRDTTVIVMSDHGFGPLHRFFYVNNWLHQEGLLVFKRNDLGSKKLKFISPSLYKCLVKAGLTPFIPILPQRLLEVPIPLFKREHRSLAELIDWKKTKAYATPMGININLKNREPEGIVDSGDFHNLVTYTIKRLCEWDEKGQTNLFETVARKEDVYDGPYADEASDIIPVFKDALPVRDVYRSDIIRDVNGEDGLCGHHRLQGILMMKGPNIRPVAKVNEMSIMDIAPTILYLMNLPMLKQMDGRVLEEVIEPDYLEANPISVTEAGAWEKREAYSFSQEEDEQLRKHLKDLGYL